MRLFTALIGVSLLLSLSGCTQLYPYRTQLPASPEIECLPNEDGAVESRCAKLLTEDGGTYKLHFAEFDDQGRPYTDPSNATKPEFQIDHFLQEVETESKNGRASVVVFVHGWLHSARSDDGNLKSFRVLLDQLSRVEAQGPCGRSVVGLYVGWRGASTKLPGHPWNTPTFWSRKLAAEHIADGSFQQILAGLKAVQQKAHGQATAFASKPGQADCSASVKTTYVGHSFGGQIVMTALAQDMARGLMRDRVNMATRVATSGRSAGALDELAIVINPAVESARFDALYRVARETHYASYQAPRFVAITSKDDWPTRNMFPLGRVINTTTKQYPKGDRGGRQAARKTVGHDANYLTHHLSLLEKPLSNPAEASLKACEAWHASSDSYTALAKIETEAASKFHSENGEAFNANAPIAWPRYFCSRITKEDPYGMIQLTRIGQGTPDANSPIWNITTSKPIVSTHTDITNVKLIEFLRQIYIDTMFF